MNRPLDVAAANLLRRARARVAAANAQTKWAFARDAEGHPVAVTSAFATSWCVVGALILEAKPAPSALEMAAGRALPRALLEEERRPRERHAGEVLRRALALLDDAAAIHAPRLSPAAWANNTTSHEATIAMFDRAITQSESQ